MMRTNNDSKIELDPWNTPAGAMENAFLAETITPGKRSKYSPDETLNSMRLMKQVLENRLKNPSLYEARGAINEFDILRMGGQFPEFTPEGHLHGAPASNVPEIVADAQNPNSANYQEYRQHVQLAIQVAHETLNPSTVKWQNVTAWRTKDHGSPGSGFYKIADFGGNTFFGTIADLAKEPPTAGKLHAIALAPSVMHDLALHQGRPTLGGFAPAPPPHGHKPAAKPVHHHNTAGETAGHGAHAGANQASETNTGFRAVLSEAKALAAKARQEREAQQGSLSRAAAAAPLNRSFAPIAGNGAAIPMRMAARQNFAGRGSANNPFGDDVAEDYDVGGGAGGESTESLRPAPATAHDAAAATLPAMGALAPGGVSQADIGRALETYARHISRLPPAGGAAFNTSLSPAWPGLKMPG
jgi:hypothetical protein